MLNSEKTMFALNDIRDDHLESARAMLGYDTGKDRWQIGKKRVITFALAATLILAFGITAYATGFFGLIDSQMGDTVVEYAGVDPVSSVIEDREEIAQGLNRVPVRVISLQGWRGSPEYLANQEWQSFYDDYVLNHYYGDEVPNPALKTDPWYDEHSRIYIAYTPRLKEKVMELCEKYSLKPLDNCEDCMGAESLYRYLGTDEVLNLESFAGQEFQLEAAEYLGYDAGTFQLQFSFFPDGNPMSDSFVDLKLNRAAKGYFRTGYALFPESQDLDEWEYTNCFGDSVCLMLAGNYGLILCDSDYAFISLQADFSFMENSSGEVISRGMLESVADLVNFGTLGQELPQHSSDNNEECAEITISPDECNPNISYATDGLTVFLSPEKMTLCFDNAPNDGSEEYVEYILRELVIFYDDGSSYVVVNTDTVNYMSAEHNAEDKGIVQITFNRLVDIENFSSIYVAVEHDSSHGATEASYTIS